MHNTKYTITNKQLNIRARQIQIVDYNIDEKSTALSDDTKIHF